jgi:carbonic anhydrase/acetyltransferase-like protein (isoleucine patch superfamily)
MTLRALGDLQPRVHPTAWVSEAAYVVGDVTIGEGSSVWPGAVLRGDFGPIRVGAHVHVEDNCVLHTGGTLTVGDDVIVGHGAILHCASIGGPCLIGNRAVLLDDAEIGDFCVVAAGSLVLPGVKVEEGSFVAGSPATVSPLSDKHRTRLEWQRRAAESGVGYSGMLERYRQAGL